MLVKDIRYGPIVEHLCVDVVESRAVGLQQHILSGLGIGIIEMDGDLYIVKHADGVVHGIIAHRLNGHRAYLYTTHNTVQIDSGARLRGEATGLISGRIVNKRHVLRPLIFTQRRLTWHQSMYVIVFKTVVCGAVARDFDAWLSTKRHGDQFAHDGNLRITFVATDDGVGQAEPRESPALAFVVLRLNS